MKVRCEVTGRHAVAGVTTGNVVELDDEQVNIRALERAGHVKRAPAKSESKQSSKTETSDKEG